MISLTRLLAGDRDYISKLLLYGLVTVMAFALTPFLIGFAIWAILFGAQVMMIVRVRAYDLRPLPPLSTGNQVTRALSLGAAPLIVFLLLNIPNVLIGLTQSFTSSIGGNTVIGGGLSAVLLCCLVPVVLVYNALMLPFFTIGMARYGETHQFVSFFQLNLIWNAISPNFGATLKYLGQALLLVLALAVLIAIPCLGWALFAIILIPSTGLLGASYALQVMGPQDKPPLAGQNRPTPTWR